MNSPLEDKSFFEQNAIIDASAGTGKTYQLINLTLRLMLEKFITIDKILMITYTKLAAAEIKRRVKEKIEEVLNTELFLGGKISPKQKDFLSKECLKGRNIPAYTIHSFCQLTIQNFYFQFNESPQLNIVDNNSNYKEKIIFFLTSNKKIIDLNKNILLYYNSIRKIIEDILNLLKNIENWFFDYKKTFIKLKLLNNEVKNDFQNIGEGVLDEFANYANSSQGVIIQKIVPYIKKIKKLSYPFTIENGKSSCMIKIGRFSLDKLRKNLKEKKQLLTIVDLIEKYTLKPNQTNEKYKEFTTEIENYKKSIAFDIWREVQKVNEYNLETDYTGLLVKTYRAIQNEDILKLVQSSYKYVFVDEFQDTNNIQWRIIKTLFPHNLCLIGDEKQAIYAFRGADVKVFREACRYLENNEAKKYTLKKNFRSFPKLIEKHNQLFSLLSFLKNFEFAKANKKSEKPNDLFFCKLKNFKGKNEYDHCIAQEIINLYKEKKISLNEICILYRSKQESLLNLQKLLVEKEIPFIHFKEELFSGEEALIVLILLNYLQKKNTPYLKALLTSSIFNFSLEKFQGEKIKIDAKVQNLLYKWESFSSKNQWQNLFESVLIETALSEGLVELNKKNSFLRFEKIFSYLTNLAYEKKLSTFNLIYYLEKEIINKGLNEEKEGKDDKEEAIKFMTIHSSKGLEFSVIFVYPLITRPKGKLEQEQEENLFYVACTRAKQYLYLPYCQENTYQHWNINEICTKLTKEKPELIKKISYQKNSTLEKEKLVKTHPLLEKNPNELQLNINKTFNSFSSLNYSTEIPSRNIFDSLKSKNDDKELLQGINLGSLTHKIFEELPFYIIENYDSGESFSRNQSFLKSFNFHYQLFSNSKNNYKKNKLWVASMIWNTLKKNLPNLGKSLSQLEKNRLTKEVEFMFYHKSNEFMEGFIDLVVENKNKFFIIDWKTNKLENYSYSFIEQTMEDNNYYQQAKIYFFALKKFLKSYSSKKIGGVFYLFTQGINLNNNDGIWFQKII